jgi:pSer/pThr/pTyr-binding forkhead associated (FHA) protein
VVDLPSAMRAVTPRELAQRLAAERRGEAFLLHLDGDGRQQISPLGAGVERVSIGRRPTSDLALTWDGEVSRLHAVLEWVGGEWTVLDEGLSRNGSYVNGQRLRGRRRLCDGDAITIGRTLLIFRAAARPDGPTTALSSDGRPPRLSDAQLRVLTSLCGATADGGFGAVRSNREIADELFLSIETVKSHLRVMFELFGVTDLPQNRKRSELARRAIEMGIVRAPGAGSVARHDESSL